MTLRNLLVRVGADVTGFSQGMKKANEALSTLGKNAQRVQNMTRGGFLGGIAQGLAAIGGGMFIRGSIEDAIKFEALMGTLSETLGESITIFQDWQEQVGSTIGFSKLQAAEMANRLSLNFKQIAKDQEDLTHKTTKMMEMAALVANKRGMAMSEVSDRIRSAMNQEADGADELGTNVRVAAIEQSEAYKRMGASGPWDKLTENMRKTILYNYILEDVSKNLGDTIQDNTQFRLMQFTAKLGDVKIALGSAFLPIMNTVLPILTKFMYVLEDAFYKVTAFFRALMPFKKGSGKTILDEQDVKKQSKGLSGIGNAAEDTGKKIEKAGKAAKRGVADFDQVHLLSETTAGGGGKADNEAGAVDTSGFDTINDSLKETNKQFDILADKYKKMSKNIKKFFDESQGWQTLKQGVLDIWEALKMLWNSRPMQGFLQAFGEDLPAFFDDLMQIAGGLFSTIGGALQEIAYLLNGDWENAWKGTEKIWWGLQDVFNGTIGLIFPDYGKKLDEATKKSKEKWGEIANYFQTTEKPIRTALEGVRQKISVELVKAIIDFSAKAKEKFDKFPKDGESAWNTTKAVFLRIFNGLPPEFQYIIDRTINGFNKTFMPILTTAKTKIDNLVNAWNKMDISFGEAIVGTFKFVYNQGAKKINGIIDLINKMVKKLNDLPGISGIPKIDYKIPYLAQGGIVSSPTLAMIGEGNEDEAVAPLSKLSGMISSAVASAMAFNGGNKVGGDIVLNIDGRTFARIVQPHLNEEMLRVGNNVRFNPI